MEPPQGRNASLSDALAIHARLPPNLPATSDLTLEAELKVRLEEIQQQREDESSAMSDRLHALVKLYKKRDQLLVDRYTECLEQASRLPRAANIRLRAKPRRGVIEQEIFYDEGVIIRFHPDPSRHLLHGDDTDEGTNTPRISSPKAATNNTPRAPSFSPLSSIRRSPKPSPKPVFQHLEERTRERTKRPPSPDELTLDPTSPRSVGPSRTSQTPPSRKPLPTHKRRKQTNQPPLTTVTATSITATTPQTPPPPASSSPLSSPSPTSETPTAPPHTNTTPIPATLASNADSGSDSDTKSDSDWDADATSSLKPKPKPKPKAKPPSKPTKKRKKAKKAKRSASRRGRPPPPPPLPCLECRRRKVRCSRARPKCEHCSRIGRDCAYPDAVRVGT